MTSLQILWYLAGLLPPVKYVNDRGFSIFMFPTTPTSSRCSLGFFTARSATCKRQHTQAIASVPSDIDGPF